MATCWWQRPRQVTTLAMFATARPPALAAMAMVTAPWLDEVTLEVSPVAVDRAGLRLRVRTATTLRDLHLAFDQPAACPCEANEAINELLDRARPAAP